MGGREKCWRISPVREEKIIPRIRDAFRIIDTQAHSSAKSSMNGQARYLLRQINYVRARITDPGTLLFIARMFTVLEIYRLVKDANYHGRREL